jgi:hypothetical protein
MLHRSDGYRLGDLARPVLRTRLAWAAGKGAGAPTVRGGCPLCETERWAERHALWSIAHGGATGDPSLPRSPDGLCVTHLVGLVDVLPWRRLPEIRERLEPFRAAPADAVPGAGRCPPDLLEPLIGADPDLQIRADAARSGGAPAISTAWDPAGWTAPAMAAELETGRCPACSAGEAALERLFDWPARDVHGTGSAGFERLCAGHTWDAAVAAPGVVPAALRDLVTRWDRYVLALPTPTQLPPLGLSGRVGAAWRAWREGAGRVRPAGADRPGLGSLVRAALRPADALGRQREAVRPRDECAACRARCTAEDRVLRLLDAYLLTAPGRALYERSDGLCLRHLEMAASRMGPASFEVALGVAGGRVALLLWELEEAGRKSSWSVRHEPRGPERTAWARALAALSGSSILQDRWLA